MVSSAKLFQKKPFDMTKAVDEIEAAVYAVLKPYGFKKHGRTLHRFVSGDLSQVIHFQAGLPGQGLEGMLCVNIGIRVPECSERIFQPETPKKTYYRESECTMRSRIGSVCGKNERWFDLRKGTEKPIKRIIKEIQEVVLPAFAVLSSREAILAHRRAYPYFDMTQSHLILLDDAMIYGHLGQLQKAKERFEAHYQNKLAEYRDACENGRKHHLKKGERIRYMDQDITAEKDGYVTIYGASRGHIEYLDELAVNLRLR